MSCIEDQNPKKLELLIEIFLKYKSEIHDTLYIDFIQHSKKYKYNDKFLEKILIIFKEWK